VRLSKRDASFRWHDGENCKLTSTDRQPAARATLITTAVIPAKAGIQLSVIMCGYQSGMPAFAGMTARIVS
jgi:hypothetical protein